MSWGMSLMILQRQKKQQRMQILQLSLLARMNVIQRMAQQAENTGIFRHLILPDFRMILSGQYMSQELLQS